MYACSYISHIFIDRRRRRLYTYYLPFAFKLRGAKFTQHKQLQILDFPKTSTYKQCNIKMNIGRYVCSCMLIAFSIQLFSSQKKFVNFDNTALFETFSAFKVRPPKPGKSAQTCYKYLKVRGKIKTTKKRLLAMSVFVKKHISV